MDLIHSWYDDRYHVEDLVHFDTGLIDLDLQFRQGHSNARKRKLFHTQFHVISSKYGDYGSFEYLLFLLHLYLLGAIEHVLHGKAIQK